MSYLPKEGYKRVAVLFMYAVIAFLALKYLLPLVLPFVTAWLAAALLSPIAGAISRTLKIPYKIAAVILLVGVIGLAVFGIYAAADKVAGELEGLGGYVSGFIEAASKGLDGAAERLSEFIPIGSIAGSIAGEGEYSASMAAELAENLVTRVTGEVAAGLSSKLPNALSALPGGMFFAFITAVAAFYTTCGYESVNERITALLPTPAAVWLSGCAKRLKGACLKYLRACLYLMAITFAELFCGFLILKIDYAFTIALLCALADLLPVIGVGTILIPWALVLILGGSYFRGVGLLIVWGVTAVVRQVLEPRIVGQSIGLDPLTTLAAMYAGYKVVGVVGMVLAPILALVVREMFVE